MSSGHPLRLAFGIAALLAIASAIFWATRPEPLTVLVRTIATGPVQATVANTRAGTVKACQRSGLSPSIGGQITALPVHEGDLVEQGQRLMELWNSDLLARLRLAEGRLEASRAVAHQACIVADTASRQATRLRALHAKGLASDEATDAAVGKARSTEAACAAACTEIEVRQAEIGVVEADLDKTRLVAPFRGTVAEVNGEVGEYVTPSPVGVPTPPAIDLIDTSCLYVSAPIDEVDAARIRTGMPARISLDAYGNRIFAGRIKRIAPYVLEVEKQARTVEVEADFIDFGSIDGMLPGYSADIEIVIDERPDVLRIPTDAVIEGHKVLVLDDDGIVEQREIETGIGNWQYTQVKAGLEAGERVIVSVTQEGLTAGIKAVGREAGRD